MPALKYWDTVTSTWKTGAVGLPSGQVWQQIIGDGLNTSFVVTHGFSTRAVSVSVYRNAPPYEEVQADVERTDTNSVTVRTYPTVPAVSEYIVAVAAAGSQATLNITMDPWHTVGAAGEPAFVNNWVNYDLAQFSGAGFRKSPDGRVALKGFIKAGTSGVMFTLPVGYRPPKEIIWTGAAHNGTAYSPVDGRVTPTGNVSIVWPVASATVWVSLESIEFDTESVLQTASVAAQPLDTVHYVGGVGEPAFVNSWVNYDNSAAVPGTATQRSLRFRKFPDGRVRVSGVIKNGTAAAIFTLPVGYRPAAVADIDVPIACAGGMGYVSIQSGGVVAVSGNTAGAAVATYAYMEFEFDSETVGAYSTGTFPYLPITMDPWHTVGAAGEPAFGAGFAHSGSQLLQFRKLPDGQVKMRGYVSGPVGGGVIFTLPVGYRPPTDYVRFPVESVTQTAGTPQTAQVFINAAGAVQAAVSQTANPVNWDLSSVLFDTDTVLQTASVAAQPIEAWHAVGAAGEPAFVNGWVNAPGDTPASFRKYPDGTVRIKGLLTKQPGNFVTDDVIFTLPAGYRPPYIQRFTTRAAGTSGGEVANRIDVTTAGVVIMRSGGAANPVAYMTLDGIEFDTETVSSYPSAFVQINAPSRVTTLPASPVDGQEVYYVADATNGVLWHLRYNAGSVSAYKWEFVGGGPLLNEAAASVATASSTYVSLANLPALTPPLGGDYIVRQGATVETVLSAGWRGRFSFSGNDADCCFVSSPGSASGAAGASVERTMRRTLVVGTNYAIAYRSDASNSIGFSNRYLEFTPVRVG